MSVLVSKRTRSARAGRTSAARAAVKSGNCRSGVTSSRIQNPRPCVATARSASLTIRSRMEVAGMFSRSGCQRSPSSNDTYTVCSVPQ